MGFHILVHIIIIFSKTMPQGGGLSRRLPAGVYLKSATETYIGPHTFFFSFYQLTYPEPTLKTQWTLVSLIRGL